MPTAAQFENYVPWPEEGCTLAEARQRTARRTNWAELQKRIANLRQLPPRRGIVEAGLREMQDDEEMHRLARRDVNEIEQEINAEFISQLRAKRLIAYGREGSLSSKPELIPSDIWPSFRQLDWDASAIGDGRQGGTIFLAVKIYPVVKAPCTLDLLASRALKDMFRQFILDDPEVAALGEAAIAVAPEYERVFKDGCAGPMGRREWPFDLDDNILSIHHPDPARQDWLFAVGDPVPIEVALAADALTDRFKALFDLLRNGQLVARAVPAHGGAQESIIQSVWSHGDFVFDAWDGDIKQIDPGSENPPLDLYRARWLAVLLERILHPPITEDRSTQALSGCQPKSVARVTTSAAAQTECAAWLKSEMSKSPAHRIATKTEWWNRAQGRWAQRLSRRAFDEAWRTAVRESGASMWASAGAPRKTASTKA